MQYISAKVYETRNDWVWKAIILGVVQKIKISPYEQFWDTNGSPNLGQTTRPNKSKKQKENDELAK